MATLQRINPASELTWCTVEVSRGVTTILEWCETEAEATRYAEEYVIDEGEEVTLYVMRASRRSKEAK